jgi:hypothetical protein
MDHLSSFATDAVLVGRARDRSAGGLEALANGGSLDSALWLAALAIASDGELVGSHLALASGARMPALR